MGFWRRSSGQESKGSPPGGSGAGAGAEPIAPFEWWDPESEALGLGRQVLRPFTYELQHRTMRNAFFEADPILDGALRPRQTVGEAFAELFMEAASNCRWNQLWSEAMLEHPAITPYLRSMLDLMVAVPHPNELVDLWVIRMPAPKAITDAHFVGLCIPFAEPGCGTPIAGRRYFTLERSDAGPDWNFFCEWDAAGRHVNLGQHGRMTGAAFAQMVLDCIRTG